MEKICYSHSRMCLIHEYSWVFISQFIFLVGWIHEYHNSWIPSDIHEWPRFSCYDLGQVWLLNVIELRKMKILAHVIFKSNLIEESHQEATWMPLRERECMNSYSYSWILIFMNGSRVNGEWHILDSTCECSNEWVISWMLKFMNFFDIFIKLFRE